MTIPIGIQGSHVNNTPTYRAHAAAFDMSSPTAADVAITQGMFSSPIQPGDYVISLLTSTFNKGGIALSYPSGFTNFASGNYGGYSDVIWHASYKVAGSSEGTYTPTSGSSLTNAWHHVIAVSNAIGAQNVSGEAGGYFGTNPVQYSLNQQENKNELLIIFALMFVDTVLTENNGDSVVRATTTTSTAPKHYARSWTRPTTSSGIKNISITKTGTDSNLFSFAVFIK